MDALFYLGQSPGASRAGHARLRQQQADLLGKLKRFESENQQLRSIVQSAPDAPSKQRISKSRTAPAGAKAPAALT